MVVIDNEQCRAVADLLQRVTIPEDREDSSLPGVSRDDLPNLLMLVVAICHQTTPATGEPPLEGSINGRVARGWDYLLYKLVAASATDALWTTPRRWEAIRPSDLQRALHDPEKGDRLTDPAGRVALLNDLGAGMIARGWSHANDIYRFCESRVLSGQPNLVHELAAFRAFSDPVRKKTNYYLSLMRNFGLWSFVDEHLLGPPADYHEARGHLRIGTVRVLDDDLAKRLVAGKLVSVAEDNAVRLAVVTAITTIAAALRITPSRAHYMFWNVFRNICTRQNPQCFHLHPNNPLPARYISLTQLAVSGRGCPFSTVCKSAGKSVMMLDPVVITEYH